jgi:parallel beta-helix repeat protein
LKQKRLIVTLILLLIGTSVTQIYAAKIEKSSQPASSDNILYVGGSGPGNYTRIQDAITNASDGDIVYVYPGVFKERIEINKSVHLQGSDPHTTIIDGQGLQTTVVTCVGTDVVINGFTICNCSMNHSCVLLNHTSGCVVQDNNIHTGGFGVIIRNSQNISIINNTFFHNLTMSAGNIGIMVDNCIYTTLSKNHISSWGGGMLIHGTHLLITHNTITDTHRGITDALNTLPGINKHLTIDNNTLDHNREGIHLAGSSDYSITHNEITNSTLVGIYIREDVYVSVYPENITIRENIVTHSTQGIVSENAINVSIEQNHIQHNTLGLLCIYDKFTSVTRNTFQDNNKTVFYYWAFFPLSRIVYKVPQFDMNFWDSGQQAPYPVFGRWGMVQPNFLFDPINIFPWVTFDWHPAQEPIAR